MHDIYSSTAIRTMQWYGPLWPHLGIDPKVERVVIERPKEGWPSPEKDRAEQDRRWREWDEKKRQEYNEMPWWKRLLYPRPRGERPQLPSIEGAEDGGGKQP